MPQFPDWFTAYYLNGRGEKCLRYMTALRGDWRRRGDQYVWMLRP